MDARHFAVDACFIFPNMLLSFSKSEATFEKI
jgi:hypothetical protein